MELIKSRQGFTTYVFAAIVIMLQILLAVVVYVYTYHNGTLEELNTKTYCDKKSQVQYIIYSDGFSSGMSVRYDKDGKPMKCKNISNTQNRNITLEEDIK